MWAGLLANAASHHDAVSPGFIAVLRQLSPAEALLLTYIYDHAPEAVTNESFDQALWASDLIEHYAASGFGEVKCDPEGRVKSIECGT